MTESDALSVSLLVNEYEQVSGLSRYMAALYRPLTQLPGVAPRLVPIEAPAMPSGFVQVMRRFGFDLGRFLQTYPVTWPGEPDDIIHLTHRAQATLLLRKPRRPVVVTVHDIIHYQNRHDPRFNTYRHPIHRWVDVLSIRALRKADAVLASSDATKTALVEEVGLDPQQIHRVYLGVDHSQFQPCSVPTAFLERYGLDPETAYILHVGTVEPRKNLPTLVNAFAQVHARHPNAKLLKIGRPLYLDAYERLVAQVADLGLDQAVVIIPDVPDEDLVFFYNLARVMTFPSLAEGFGFPVLEAMACGTPVVCSNVTSLPELVGDAALTVDPHDTAGLAEAMCLLLGSEEKRLEYRERGLNRVRLFSWEKTALETVQVYQMLAGGKHA